MTIVESPAAMQEQALAWRAQGQDLALVPTMGALHAGHQSLVERARRENQRVIVSVFVNPMQFGPLEDLGRYPRPFDRDLALLESLRVDAVFHPAPEQMYPASFRTTVDPGPLGEVLEGRSRKGHFTGVLTVVLKLFLITQPKRAYFGQKDVQQLLLVRQLVRDLNLSIRVVSCPTVREPDGLAMSSRNVYLDAEQRRRAPALHDALRAAALAFRGGEDDPVRLEAAVSSHLAGVGGLALDYVALFDETTLERPARAMAGNVLAAAVTLGATRLIDNVVFGAESL